MHTQPQNLRLYFHASTRTRSSKINEPLKSSASTISGLVVCTRLLQSQPISIFPHYSLVLGDRAATIAITSQPRPTDRNETSHTVGVQKNRTSYPVYGRGRTHRNYAHVRQSSISYRRCRGAERGVGNSRERRKLRCSVHRPRWWWRGQRGEWKGERERVYNSTMGPRFE